MPTTTIAKQREDLEALTVAVLTSYRRYCAARSTNEGQLILPESLKLLPLYVCMYFKTPQLSSGPLDVRASALAAQLSASPRCFAMGVKPRLLDVAAAEKDVGPNGETVWRPSGYLTVTGECIAADGVYLLENGRYVRFPSVCAPARTELIGNKLSVCLLPDDIY
jgi:protein transport protein SEC24